jgi:predicted glycoside hydrolase/deacetylase ChbG (UPF0249 family)
MCALMINADDWGASASTTDAIASCFRLGAVSAASAMVFMADSERAAGIALELGLPVGLHLNLSQPFDGPAPDDVRARQLAVTRGFTRMWLRRWTYDPRGRGRIAHAIADQLQEFERLYGHPPARLDGHLHVHLCPDVLLSRALPRDVWLRPARTRALERRRPGVAALRRARDRWLHRRFHATQHFFAIQDLHPRLGGHGLDGALALARSGEGTGGATVEVMTHPAAERPAELELLLSQEWRDAVAREQPTAFPARHAG